MIQSVVEVFRTIPYKQFINPARNYLPSGIMVTPYNNGSLIRYHLQSAVPNSHLSGVDPSTFSKLSCVRALQFFNALRNRFAETIAVPVLQMHPWTRSPPKSEEEYPHLSQQYLEVSFFFFLKKKTTTLPLTPTILIIVYC